MKHNSRRLEEIRIDFDRKSHRLYHIYGNGTLCYEEMFHQNTMEHVNTEKTSRTILKYVKDKKFV